MSMNILKKRLCDLAWRVNDVVPYDALDKIEQLELRVKTAEALLKRFSDFTEGFAAEIFPPETPVFVQDPQDEIDPVTDASMVWAWQNDAKTLLKEIKGKIK